MKVGRRRFIGFMAGAAAGTAVGLPVGRSFEVILSSADTPFFPLRGPESFSLSVCGMCPAGCGVRARLIGERVVKLEGNPLHPISGGRLCVKGQAALQALYHPDRVRTPLRRVGTRGSIRSFRRASWDEAFAEISGRLTSLREQNRPEGLVLARGSDTSLDVRVARRFVEAFGSPNDICFDRGDEAAAIAVLLTQGVRKAPALDLHHADYVLSLGSDVLEASSSPVFLSRAYGDFRQTRTAMRGKLIHVDPRLSITASSADEWIAIRPGTHAIFALGVASCLVAEGLYDKEFVADRSNGFENGDDDGGLRRLLQERYRLENVASETGVSVNVILRVAREFAGAKHSIAIGPRKGPLVPGDLFDHFAAHVLNALVGNIDQPGGVLIPEEAPLAAWPQRLDAIAAEGRKRQRLDGITGDSLLQSDPERLADALLARQPYPADVLFIMGADPLFASAAPDRFAAAFERVPLTVSFAAVPNDTAIHSDWILPEAQFLERWELQANVPAAPFPLVSLAPPALKNPAGQARSVAEVFLDMAKRLGLESSFPATDPEGIARADMDSVYQAHRGSILGTEFDEAWVRMMENAGWWAPGFKSADELWSRATETGGWWDPFYDHGDWSRVLQTKSGRFEFRPDVLKKLGEEHRPSMSRDGTRSLALVLFEPLAVSGGSGAEFPFLQTLLDPGHPEQWGTWGEMSAETAHHLGVHDGDTIRVSTGDAAITVRARVTERVVAGVVAIPLGLGKKGGGRWAAGIGANPLRLLSGDREAVSLLPRFETAVQVAALSGERGRRG